MKRLFCLTAAFGLMSTAAFGQGARIPSLPNEGMGTSVYLRSSGGDADSANLADLVSRALDKSRSLHLVAAPIDDTMEINAPITMTKESDGKRVKVTYDIKAKNSTDTRTFTATCAITQLDRCADAIALRAERFARETKMMDGTSDGM